MVQAEFALRISELNLRQYDAAIATFQNAKPLAPNNYDAQIWLENAYQSGGRANDAAAAYMRAATPPGLRSMVSEKRRTPFRLSKHRPGT